MRGKITALVASALVLAGAVAWAGKLDPALFSAGTDREAGATLSFSTREEFRPNGFIRILVLRGGAWQEAARIAVDEHLRTRTVDLASWLSGSRLALRLEPIGPGAAHLDAVSVDGEAAQALDPRLGRKLSAADNDVVDFTEVTGLDLAFSSGRSAQTSITARMEPAVIGTEPAAYPTVNAYRPVSAFQSFYRYRVGSRIMRPIIDGSLRSETPGAPLVRESVPLGSGHPESPTWAWVGDDGINLYALIDFTADNTLDGGKDYARLHVKTAGGIRTFGVTAVNERWGKAGFEYTDRVGWEHKVYEIAVPLSEIGGIAGGDVDLAFTVYGTASAYIDFDGDTDPNGVDPDSGARGDTFTFTVKYEDNYVSGYAPLRSDLWIDVDGDKVEDAVTPLAPLGRSGPWIGLGVAVTAAALLFASRRRPRARLAAVMVAAVVALTTCKLPTTQEIYPMTAAGADWLTGVVFTAEVQLVLDPGSYTFKFLFVDSLTNKVLVGTATGPHTVIIE